MGGDVIFIAEWEAVKEGRNLDECIKKVQREIKTIKWAAAVILHSRKHILSYCQPFKVDETKKPKFLVILILLFYIVIVTESCKLKYASSPFLYLHDN